MEVPKYGPKILEPTISKIMVNAPQRKMMIPAKFLTMVFVKI